MSLAVIGETVNLSVSGNTYRAYEFDIVKTGNRVSVKAFEDPVGTWPEIQVGAGKEITIKFRDNVQDTFEINNVYTIVYEIDSVQVSGYYKCLEIQGNTNAEGIGDYTATFKHQALSA